MKKANELFDEFHHAEELDVWGEEQNAFHNDSSDEGADAQFFEIIPKGGSVANDAEAVPDENGAEEVSDDSDVDELT